MDRGDVFPRLLMIHHGPRIVSRMFLMIHGLFHEPARDRMAWIDFGVNLMVQRLDFSLLGVLIMF